MKTSYICSFPTAFFNDLEGSAAGSTVKTVASTIGRWHARDKEEERKEQAEVVAGIRYGNQRVVCLWAASNSSTGFGNIIEREENGWG